MKKYLFIISLTVLILILMFMSMVGIISSGIGMIVTTILILMFNIIGVVLAKKEKIDFIFYTMLIFAIISFIVLIINIICIGKTAKSNTFDFQITAETTKREKSKIFTYNGADFYSYNMKNINCIKSGHEVSLEQALNSGLTINEIKKAMIADEKGDEATVYRDGGVANIQNSSYSIIFCNDGKNKGDIIIAPFNYEYKKGICS